MMEHLKPCPFCGAEPAIGERVGIGNRKYFYIACENDNCRINPGTDLHIKKSVVIKEWNRRASDERN